MNILKVCVKGVTWNNPPYKPIPLSKHKTNKLLKAKKLANSSDIITILENKIDWSFLKVRALEIKRYVNKNNITDSASMTWTPNQFYNTLFFPLN